MPAHGLLVINKPEGVTSRQATNQVSRLLAEKKAGHLGTLDPLATGVLPVVLGQATRLAPFLEPAEKIYRAVIRLGEATDTHDREGKIISRGDYSALTREQVATALATFHGEILQVPPMHSALKKDGVPLYQLAREGKEVRREPRKVKVISLVLEEFALPDLTLRLHCSAGFYVRVLAHDLGQLLSTGAHLRSLTRLASGHFRLEDAVPLDHLSPNMAREKLIPPALCLPHFPAVEVSEEEAALLRHGRQILASSLPGLQAGDQLFRLLYQGELVAIAEAVPCGQEIHFHPLRVCPRL